MHPPTYQQLHFWVFVPEKTKIYIHTKTCMRLLKAASFLTAKTGNTPDAPQWVNGSINYGTSTTQRKKGTTVDSDNLDESQRTMLSEKMPTPRLCTVRSYLHSTVERTELWKWGTNRWVAAWSEGQSRDGCGCKRARGILVRESSPSWLYLWQRPGCDLALILILQNVTTEGELAKGYRGSLCVVSHLQIKAQWSQSEKLHEKILILSFSL